MTQRVGFIGAGQMGEPMVYRLLAAGYVVTVMARRDDVRDRLHQAGATVVSTVEEAARDQQVIICCLFSDDQLKAVALGEGGAIAHASAGAILVSHTTGGVATLRDLSAARPDVTILDAPISGTAEDIANGQLTVMIGGPSHPSDQVASIVGAYSSTVLHTGELGTALNLKLVNNVLFAANAQLVAAAVEVAGQLGIDAERLVRALASCSADSKAAGYVRMVGGIGNFTEMAAPFLRKDVDAALAAVAEANADLGLLYDVVQRGPLPLTSVSETV